MQEKIIADNPLLTVWDTPHQTPPFSRIADAHYAPAIREGIRMAEANIDAIARQSEPPTFENTIMALEKAAESLDRSTALLLNLNECCTNQQLQQTVLEIMPELTQYENRIWMNRRLFARVETIYQSRNSIPFDSEQTQLLEKYYQHFIRNGVNLDAEKKQRFATCTEELATLTETFNQNALHDTNDFTLHLTDSADLEGLPDGICHEAHDEALRRGLEGWVFTLHAPSYRPFLTYAANRKLRERMWRAYNSRGNRGSETDNKSIIARIVALRLEIAQLLGYDDYASYSLCRTMAQDAPTVNKFLDDLLQASLPFARQDLEEVQQFARQHGADYTLQNWDFSYWSERLKQQRYDFDSEALRPYFKLDNVRQGIFDLYGRLYGVSFVERNDVEVYHNDVKVFEVRDGERLMGLLYLDMFPRESKRSGAWMTEFRGQSFIGDEEVRPLIQVVCNFTKSSADRPSLLTFDEMETFMHEMGHAMHGMLSDVRYPSVSGTNVRHDFVEMPSQVMENWCYEPEFLNTFAFHYQTGEPIPTEYIDKIRRAERYLAGWLCVRQLNFGRVDMAYHTIRQPLPAGADIERFEHNSMVELLPTVEGCCSSTSFTHIFCGGYAAGYYGYKWAEVLDADIFSRFKESGIFDRDTATAFRREILSRGGSEHPAVLFRNFMGRDPDNDALLRRCGFTA
ncbi:MAG: M3 family metallopeptidase [Bacteroidales bacterium]|nr:M3 family metallopeptidase [Bacteroidales bacterium]